MPKLTPINLQRDRGRYFAMAFIYTKEGTKLLTGDIWNIDKYCKEHFGLCHGMLVIPNRMSWLDGKKYIKRWRLFGENIRSSIFLTDFDMDRLNSPNGSGKYWREKGIKRPCWALYQKGGNIIRTWRRLPKKYINWDNLIASVK